MQYEAISIEIAQGIASFRKDIDIEACYVRWSSSVLPSSIFFVMQISNRGLDSLDLSTMFTQEAGGIGRERKSN